MTVVPEASAFTMPLVLPIVATELSPLLHVPPVAELLNVAAEPAQSVDMPDMTDDAGFTVITFIAVQPEPKE